MSLTGSINLFTAPKVQRMLLKDLAEQNVPIWRSVRKEFLKNLSRAKSTLRTRRRPGEAPDSAEANES